MGIAIVPSQANRIRALKAASPWMTAEQVAWKLDIQPNVVKLALVKGDTRRIKSVAP